MLKLGKKRSMPKGGYNITLHTLKHGEAIRKFRNLNFKDNSPNIPPQFPHLLLKACHLYSVSKANNILLESILTDLRIRPF